MLGAPTAQGAVPSQPAPPTGDAPLGPAFDLRALDPTVSRLLEAVGRARGPEAYALLREVWQAWEQADPTEVEAALHTVAEDGSAEPATRAYARLLEAYARRRRGDLPAATRLVRELGYVSDWLVVGPFNNDNKAGFGQLFRPEQELGEPVQTDRSYDGKVGPVRWRHAPDVHHYGWLDFGALLRPQAFLCAFSTTYLRAPGMRPEGRDVALWLGATGAVQVFWNAERVAQDDAYRQLDVDRMAIGVRLHPGFNRLTVKACGDDSAPAVTLRVAEPDGSPARGIEISSSPEASTAAATWQRQHPAPEPPKAPQSGLWPLVPEYRVAAGPLQRFEQALRQHDKAQGACAQPLAAGAEPTAKACPKVKDPALLEQYARYLMLSGADPDGSHTARDLASRAAEAEPTVERLLLAGKLGEDRNQRRRWVDAAASPAQSPSQRVEVLLAQAALARTGPHWLDAIPLYDQVLALEPNEITATLGKADLYVEAGLGRTALATLERATAAHPRSVALLRALASQLRALGRDTEAAEVEGRYAALRFDDAGYLQRQIDLAVARGESAGMRRWAARLLAADPSSSWAYGVVARAERALGDMPMALETYRRALDVAPDDVGTLRALVDLHGELGHQDEQARLLRQLLRVEPQAKDVRSYLEHLVPSGIGADEKYAWPAERFLGERAAPAGDAARRTLRNLTVTTLLPNGLATHFHQFVFQPLNAEAAAASRQYAFSYQADRQVVQLRAAKVYRADGRVDEAVEEGSVPADDPSLRMYTLQRSYLVQFPRLEVGDVVELRYRVEDVGSASELGETFGEIELLQASEPLAHVEYVIIAPKDKPLQLSATALPGLEREVRDDGERRIYRFSAEHVAAVRSEPGMPPWPEVLGAVHASTFRSWEELGRWYWGLVRDQLDVDDEVRRRAHQLTQGLSDARAKVLAIYRFAATETRYVGLELGIEGIRPRRAALTLARGWGDCKDKAALIVSMLREIGIEAELVIVRSGMRGRFDVRTPSLAPFDHAIVYVPSLDLYLDGTAEQTGLDELPPADRGAMALRVSGGKGILVELPDPPPERSIESRQLELQLKPDGALTFQASFETSGAFAPAWRQRYHTESTVRDRLTRDLSALLGPAELSPGQAGLKIGDLDALDQPVRVVLHGRAQARVEGSTVSVPLASGERLGPELASLPRREQELLLGPMRRRDEVWTVKIPAGMRVASLPRAVRLESPFARYELSVEHDGDRVTARSSLTFLRARVRQSEYAAWRAFVDEVDRAAAPRLGLER